MITPAKKTLPAPGPAAYKEVEPPKRPARTRGKEANMEEKKVVSFPEELSEETMEQVSGGKESGDTKQVTFTYRCPYCERLLKGAKALQDHIREKHQ